MVGMKPRQKPVFAYVFAKGISQVSVKTKLNSENRTTFTDIEIPIRIVQYCINYRQVHKIGSN